MFKVLDMLVSGSLYFAETALDSVDGKLRFGGKRLPTYDEDECIPGTLLTISVDGDLIPMEDTRTISIHIDPVSGDDENIGSLAMKIKTLDTAIELSKKFKMFNSVKFILYGDATISSDSTIDFPSEVHFIGDSNDPVRISMTEKTGGGYPSIEVDSNARVILDNIKIIGDVQKDTASSFISGRPNSISLIDSQISLPTNMSLVESYFNIDVRLISSSIDNTNGTVISNLGGSFVRVSGDGSSTISNLSATEIASDVVSFQGNTQSNITISILE